VTLPKIRHKQKSMTWSQMG